MMTAGDQREQSLISAFGFATAGRIIFGNGARRQLPDLAGGFGRRILLVVGRDASRIRDLTDSIAARAAALEFFTVPGEPSVSMADSGAASARAREIDVVISIGGGSVIDAGKAIAALAPNGRPALDHLEVVGQGNPLDRPSLPFIAVPTTAGTGAEVTRNAVLAVPEAGVKASLRSAHMLPAVALVDPELTHSAPPAITAATGMDALTQLIEAYLCNRTNPLTDGFCRDGIPRAARAIRRAFADPVDASARTDMSFASLLGGLALANAGLGAVHGFAAPIGGAFPAPHGAVCAALLPHSLRVNLHTATNRAPNQNFVRRLEEVGRMLTGKCEASAADAVTWCAALAGDLGILSLSQYGVRDEYVPDLVAKAENASSMKANPIQLKADELAEILTAACA